MSNEDVSIQSESRRPQQVFIAGGTGFLGQPLVRALLDCSSQVVVLSRNPAAARKLLDPRVEIVEGDPTSPGTWQERISGQDAVVNLAGHPIGPRWNAHTRQLINDSRVDSTRLLVDTMGACPMDQRPRVLINGSGVDYYPFCTDLGIGDACDSDPITEQAAAGDTALARICHRWEAEAERAESFSVRVVRLRIGLVLGPGGFLSRLVVPFRMGLGGRLGSGTQWVSWIHREDFVQAVLFSLIHEAVRGPVNVVAPGAVRNREFTLALGRAIRRPVFLTVPKFVLRTLLGDMAEYVLHGRRAVPEVLVQHGFSFRYSQLDAALAQVFS